MKIARLEPVGNYAVRIVFDDGHDSGLYSWDYLHELGSETRHERSDDAPPTKRRPSASPRAPAAAARIAIIKGQDAGRFTDFYHGVLTASWPVFFLQLAAMFVAVNLIFAMLYVARPRRHRQCPARQLRRRLLLQRADPGHAGLWRDGAARRFTPICW